MRTYLKETLKDHDALILKVYEVSGQDVKARIEKVYSRRFTDSQKYMTQTIEFVGSAGNWGNVTLKEGETALVFISYSTHSLRYYQRYWHGHFTIETIDHVECAIAHWTLMSHSREPQDLANSMFLPNPQKTNQVAMPFDLLEKLLIETLTTL